MKKAPKNPNDTANPSDETTTLANTRLTLKTRNRSMSNLFKKSTKKNALPLKQPKDAHNNIQFGGMSKFNPTNGKIHPTLKNVDPILINPSYDDQNNKNKNQIYNNFNNNNKNNNNNNNYNVTDNKNSMKSNNNNNNNNNNIISMKSNNNNNNEFGSNSSSGSNYDQSTSNNNTNGSSEHTAPLAKMLQQVPPKRKRGQSTTKPSDINQFIFDSESNQTQQKNKNQNSNFNNNTNEQTLFPSSSSTSNSSSNRNNNHNNNNNNNKNIDRSNDSNDSFIGSSARQRGYFGENTNNKANYSFNNNFDNRNVDKNGNLITGNNYSANSGDIKPTIKNPSIIVTGDTIDSYFTKNKIIIMNTVSPFDIRGDVNRFNHLKTEITESRRNVFHELNGLGSDFEKLSRKLVDLKKKMVLTSNEIVDSQKKVQKVQAGMQRMNQKINPFTEDSIPLWKTAFQFCVAFFTLIISTIQYISNHFAKPKKYNSDTEDKVVNEEDNDDNNDDNDNNDNSNNNNGMME